MAFVISWSSVSSASVNPMHTVLLNSKQTVMPIHHESERHLKDVVMSECHENLVEKEIIHSKTMDCHSQTHGLNCQECSAFTCQAPPVYDTPTSIQLITSDIFKVIIFTFADDCARYLTGYWQEIMRPPKT